MQTNRSVSKSTKIAWQCIKIPFILFWLFLTIYILFQVTPFSSDKGICQFFDCNVFIIKPIKYLIVFLSLLLSVFYIFEIKMKLTTFMLFLLSLFIFSIHESYGIALRTGIITFIFFSQFMAYKSKYLSNDETFVKNRINYSIQVIVACYSLSAISKIITSGYDFISDVHLMSLQMLKSNQMKYLDGIIDHAAIFSPKIDLILHHQEWMTLLLLFALLIELTSGLACLSKKTKLIYGLLLLFLHIGIAFFFHIVIVTFLIPMIIFMLNPFYLVYRFYSTKQLPKATN